jgi:hypothetical protein
MGERGDIIKTMHREMATQKPVALRKLGFGREVRDALTLRGQWLVGHGFACEEQDRTLYRGNMLIQLRDRELKRVAGQLSEELGLAYTEARSGLGSKASIAGTSI